VRERRGLGGQDFNGGVLGVSRARIESRSEKTPGELFPARGVRGTVFSVRRAAPRAGRGWGCSRQVFGGSRTIRASTHPKVNISMKTTNYLSGISMGIGSP